VKDPVEIISALIAAGVTLTFVAIIFTSPNTGNVLTSGANAFRTTFGTFLGQGGGVSAPSVPAA
jgi:hypothetical protein